MNRLLNLTNNLPGISFLRGQWLNFWDWIKIVHSASDEASSKRFYGGVFSLTCVVSFLLFSAGVFDIAIWTVVAPYWTFLLLVGAAFLSISTVEKLANIIANFKISSLSVNPPKQES